MICLGLTNVVDQPCNTHKISRVLYGHDLAQKSLWWNFSARLEDLAWTLKSQK